MSKNTRIHEHVEIKIRPISIFLLTLRFAWNIALIHGHDT